MATIVSLARLLKRSGIYILDHIKSNGGFAVAFVVMMLMLHCVLLATGAIMHVLGDSALIEAALQSTTIVAPLITAAGVTYRACDAARTKAEYGFVPYPK
jgi:hypothetical protein